MPTAAYGLPRPGFGLGLVPPAPSRRAAIPYFERVLATPNLLSLWKMDDASSTLVDVVRGINGTLSGSYSMRVAGPSAGIPFAVSFTGGDATAAQTQPSVSDWTVEVWLKTTDDGGNIINSRSPSNSKSMTVNFLGYSGYYGCPQLYLDSDGIGIGKMWTAIHDGKWHHLVLTWDGTTGVGVAGEQIVGYIDGRFITGTVLTPAGSQNAPVAGGTTTTIGGLNPASMAALAIYDRALTAEEALSHYVAAGYLGG